jgi:hypothetical protein
MRRVGTFLLIWAASACSFESRVTGGDAGDDVAGDAAVGEDGMTPDAPAPDAPPAPVTCTITDPDVRLCLELDDVNVSSMAVDGSGLEHHATVGNVSVATRNIPTSSQAIGIMSDTAIVIADSADFDLQEFTITAWVQRTALPQFGQEYGVVDFGRQQASLAIDDEGRVSCFVRVDGQAWYWPNGSTTNGEWALAACSYETPLLCATVFRNGDPATGTRTCGSTGTGTVSTSINTGGTIGALFASASGELRSRFAGNVDSIRVYDRELSEQEICAKSGLIGC